MGPRGGSSIGAFLMSLPVSAILLMAVFGIPRFDPGTAGESGWQNARQLFDSLRGGAEDKSGSDPFRGSGGSRAGEAGPFSQADTLAEAPAWDGQSNTQGDVSDWRRSFADDRGTPRDSAGSRTAEEAGHSLLRGDAGSSRSTATTATITWTDARRRLADLGVDRFHLEAGLTPDQFLFVCLFSPAGDSRVTQRFESEAADPLVAVEQVLSQIERWSSQRYAQDTQSRLTPGR
ncbi:MAG: hypothetical protein ACK5Q5_01445 [Planctomycetaceae bacterium]